jgi:hypothetical protein
VDDQSAGPAATGILTSMADMLRFAAGATHGIFTAQQALSHGVSVATLQRMVRVGECIRLRRGLFAFAGSRVELPVLAGRRSFRRSPDHPGYPEDRHALLARAILLQQGGDLAASHHSSAILAGLPVWGMRLAERDSCGLRANTVRCRVAWLSARHGLMTHDMTRSWDRSSCPR